MTDQHKVQQDQAYVSVIPQPVVDAFLKEFGKPPVANKAALAAAQKKPAKDPAVPENKRISISQDMPLAPATYGFADKAAVQDWFQKAFDTPV